LLRYRVEPIKQCSNRHHIGRGDFYRMGTRHDIMRHAGILPIELPSGSFIGAVPAWPVVEPDEPDEPLADE
jgi:hypothetical protein